MEPIETRVTPQGLRVSVIYDHSPESPRHGDNLSSICIRQNLRYDFPNELGVNFDDLEDTETVYDTDSQETVSDHEKKKLEWCHVFPLDCHERGSIRFSLSWTRIQCRFDTSSDVWFVAVPRTVTESPAEARSIAASELATYNAYVNGECYGYEIHKPLPTFYADGSPASAEYELIGSCFGYYDQDEALEAWIEAAANAA